MYEDYRSIPLITRIRRLGTACTVLHVGSHPDDEDTGTIAALAHRHALRVVYWSATRGEGGQNRVNAYRDEALGIYRTWESLAARALDGGESRFGPFIDYGYSKNGEEALTRWGHERLVREIVRAIRHVQPHVLIARWRGEPSDGHGHHQGVGRATLEAVAAAGDPARFPELATVGLAPWRPVKVYHSLGGDWQPGEDMALGARHPELERDGVVRVDTGGFDPILGRSYQQQAWLAFNSHQTQAMGLAPARGSFYYYYKLHESLVPTPPRERTLLDGLEPGLAGLAAYPGEGSGPLRERLATAGAWVEEALSRYRPDDPLPVAEPLLEGVSALRDTRAALDALDLSQGARVALDTYLARRITAFEEVAARCAGLEFEALSARARVVPGQRFRVTTHLWNPSGVEIERLEITPCTPDTWDTSRVDAGPAAPGTHTFELRAPEGVELTCPYWLALPRGEYAYTWPKDAPAGSPFGAPPLRFRCEVTIGAHRLTLTRPALMREAFPGGFRELPVAIIPPISLHPETTQEYLPIGDGARERTISLQVVARNNADRAMSGTLELELPGGWRVTPERVDLALDEPGGARNVRLTVTVPVGAREGRYPLRYRIRCGGRDYSVVLTPVWLGAPGLMQIDGSNCLAEAFITAPAEVTAHLIDTRFEPSLRYAYVEGARESLLDALRPCGLDFHLISDSEMGYIDLERFDVIVVGPNAYLLREALRQNAARFLDFVRAGGTLIVQYQGYGYEGRGFTPYPFRYSQPHDRVTQEDAPVEFLVPDHILFSYPNRILRRDWEGWVRERGLYFFGEWDRRYLPLVASADPGESPKAGGLLECQHGRGTFVYTGYSFFRQLAAGVPGAFRIFANLLALPRGRRVERSNFLRDVFPFAALDEKHLAMIADIMAERWLPDGTYLCHQGDEGDELYVVYRGRVRVIQTTDGVERLLYTAGVGTCLGEFSVLGSIPRTASLVAEGDVQLLVVRADDFQPLLRRYPDISIQMMRLLLQKLFRAERA